MSEDLSPPELDDYEEFVERRFDGMLARLELVEEELVVLEQLVSQLEAIAEDDPTSGSGFLPPDSDAVDRANDSITDIAAAIERMDRNDDETEDITEGADIENIDDDTAQRPEVVDDRRDPHTDDGR